MKQKRLFDLVFMLIIALGFGTVTAFFLLDMEIIESNGQVAAVVFLAGAMWLNSIIKIFKL